MPIAKMTEQKEIVAAGVVLYRKATPSYEVALIYRKKKWDLPKGKRESGESESECAKREAEEELGIHSVTILDLLCTTFHEYEAYGTHWGKTTFWYAAQAPEQTFNAQAEEDIEKVQWTELHKAQQLVDYENLKTVLEAFKKKIVTERSV